MPARLAPDQSRGFLVAIGIWAGLDKEQRVARRLLAICSQRAQVTLVLAGELDSHGLDELESNLLALGAGGVRRLHLTSRADAERPETVTAIESSDLIVLATIHPLKLTTLIGGTTLAKLLRRRNADGIAIAGMGPGAAAITEHMLAGGDPGITPRIGGVTLAPGLGLTNRVVIDQGGAASDRIGRLLGALALNPFALGLGLDADTAAVIGPDNVMEVVGHGGVTLVDPRDVGPSNITEAGPQAPISITNLRLHVLVHGTRYDLDFRRPL
ncbi:cyanophycinase [Tahibacter amnicola]|uniref:Cyanophycinase n=1 Tax=Tahibacter amnicola TaxID=2976241 RepID=A0ABY6BD08_9GAMM|nr:cyanophycinase [Tahibacter amnicola]UXI67093.1 cyanophycinase [Tahibacter amnicola]